MIGLFNPCAGILQKAGHFQAARSGQRAKHRAARFIYTHQNPAEQDRAVRCLTDALYYEAANEPVEGQRAIAQVVVNRVRDKHFPKSVCGVVYQGWERHTGCQFSFRLRRLDPPAARRSGGLGAVAADRGGGAERLHRAGGRDRDPLLRHLRAAELAALGCCRSPRSASMCSAAGGARPGCRARWPAPMKAASFRWRTKRWTAPGRRRRRPSHAVRPSGWPG